MTSSRRSPAELAVLIANRLVTLVWGLARTLRLPPRSIATTFRVAALMAVVEVLVRYTPLPKVAALLRVRLDLKPSSSSSEPIDLSELSPVARRQVTCTNRVADAWPFSDGPCLRRTLVAGRLLRDHEPAIRIGLRGADAGASLTAHAWLELGGRPLEDISDIGAFAIAGVDT